MCYPRNSGYVYEDEQDDEEEEEEDEEEEKHDEEKKNDPASVSGLARVFVCRLPVCNDWILSR
jgi:hypothetical protein